MLFNSALLCVVLAIITCCPEVSANCNHCKCSADKHYGGTYVDCFMLGLTGIPKRLPSNTTTLIFNNNKIANLSGKNLKLLSNLRFLDVSSNAIDTIDENAFHGLSKLLVLNLSSNRLALTDATYLPNLFKTLRNLKTLRLEENNSIETKKGSYPDKSFRVLTSLKELYLDGLPADFGPNFAEMRMLSTLSLSSLFCYLPVLRNTTFVNVPTVQHLNISHCQIQSTELLTFSPLKQIRTIEISDNYKLGFLNFSRATFGVQHSPLEVLKMNRIYPEFDVCSHLKVAHWQYLQYTNLKELHLDGNGIIGIELGTLSTLPKTLEIISAKNNKFQYGWFVLEFGNLKALKYVDISGINNHGLIPILINQRVKMPVGSTLSLPSKVPVPPKLETLVVAQCSITGTIGSGGITTNILKNIIANDNFISSLDGPQPGCEHIEHFDLSNNVLEVLKDNYFSENNSVSNVSLSNNFLGKEISEDIKGNMFRNLSKARFLDISNNRIEFLPTMFFTGLKRIETINVRDNYLERFEVDLSGNRHMSVLNLEGNRLQMLTSTVMNQLENVSVIHLQGNPILCSCGNLHFLKWINANRSRIIDIDNITCTLKINEPKRSFANLDVIIETLEKECKSGNILAISVTLSMVLLILGVISASVCYRHRWKLRYLYHVGRQAYRHHDIDFGDDDMYQYDVFVSYAAPDRRFVIDVMMPELETKAGLRMCIHDRDFLPGEVIATNIVNAIQNSRKTLIVLSPSFLKSDWCEFEYNMARLEGVTQRQNIVVVVLYKPVPMKDLPKDMAIMFRNNCYLEYNDEEFGSIVFWQNVVQAVRSLRQRE